MKRVIIGFTGPIGAGKSTAANVLVQQGWRRVRFAGPLKAMAQAFGLSFAQVDGDLKETPSELICRKTPRFFMQRLGTEFGRQMIGDDLWIRAFKHAVGQVHEDAPIVVDDIRFANEAEAVRSLGGIVVRIDRIGHVGGTGHASEAFDFTPDFAIANHRREVFEEEVRAFAMRYREFAERDAA